MGDGTFYSERKSVCIKAIEVYIRGTNPAIYVDNKNPIPIFRDMETNEEVSTTDAFGMLEKQLSSMSEQHI